MNNMINNKHIIKAIFVFNANTLEFLTRYDGVVECGKALKIHQSKINNYLDSLRAN